MNRQYTTSEFLRMVDDVHAAFDRPAITTDLIAGFPGESDDEFLRTLRIVDSVRFIHIHAFSFSPRPGTAAARWTRDFVRGPVVNERIHILTERSARHSYDFRRQFLGQDVELLIERQTGRDATPHGRSERYFEVFLDNDDAQPGDAVKVVIDRVTAARTWGRRVG
jgi:threonylcarbamoyladenosine tRNA methylthiotransferase MtaB